MVQVNFTRHCLRQQKGGIGFTLSATTIQAGVVSLMKAAKKRQQLIKYCQNQTNRFKIRLAALNHTFALQFLAGQLASATYRFSFFTGTFN